MKIKNLTPRVVKKEINSLKTLISAYISSLLINFLPDSSLKMLEEQLQEYHYDSVIKSILEKIFQYAKGDLKLKSKEEKYMMHQACDKICSILWASPSSSNKYININWTEWVKTPLGFAIKACYARLKDTLTCEELGILLGYTRQEISRRAKLNLIPNKRVGGSYIFFKKELLRKKILPDE